jgi:hypothetical protein
MRRRGASAARGPLVPRPWSRDGGSRPRSRLQTGSTAGALARHENTVRTGCVWVADSAANRRILPSVRAEYQGFNARTTTAASSTSRSASSRRGSASSHRDGNAASARRWRRRRRRAIVTRPSARHRHLVAFGVHALHVRHVVALLGRHVAAGRLRYLLRSELSARAVVRLKLLDSLAATGKDHDARAGWRGSATGDQDGRRDRDCGTTKCLHAGVRTGNADSAIVYRRSRTGATTSSKSRALTPRCRHYSYVTRRAWRRSAAKIPSNCQPHVTIVHDHIELFVHRKGSIVQIRAADRGPHAVDHDGFRMQQRRAVLERT